MRELRLPIRFGRGDLLFAWTGFGFRKLGRDLFPLCAQLLRFQLHDQLPLRQRAAVDRAQRPHAPAVTRGDADFVRLDGAGNRVGIGLLVASPGEDCECDNQESPNEGSSHATPA